MLIPLRLIESVTTHIEMALAMGYAEHIIFSDMGHSHILIPLDDLIKSSPPRWADTLSFYYNHPRTKFLYHTAEQLQMMSEDGSLIDDPYLQRRYFTRNLIADNTNSGNLYILQAPPTESFNTVRTFPRHHYGAGFDISANQDGCFPFFDKDNKLKFFDISPSGHYATRYDIKNLLKEKNP